MHNRCISVHKLDRLPPGCHYLGELSELEPDELDAFERIGVEAVWYWYAVDTCAWEGYGHALMLRAGRWQTCDISHGSDHTPDEYVVFGRGYASLDELSRGMSEEALRDIAPLLEAARSATS